VSSGVLVQRVFSLASLGKIANVTSSVAFLCWAAPGVMVAALPGVAANLAGRPDALQAGLISHYIWPILPWIFVASIDGFRRVLERFPRRGSAVIAVLVAITVVDSPLWRIAARRPWRQAPAAALVKEQLQLIPADASVLSQASLIPQLPHRRSIEAIGRELGPDAQADYVAIGTVGDLWPLDHASVAAEIERLKRDDRLTMIADGPLYVFKRLK
jgi:hypothetical protein